MLQVLRPNFGPTLTLIIALVCQLVLDAPLFNPEEAKDPKRYQAKVINSLFDLEYLYKYAGEKFMENVEQPFKPYKEYYYLETNCKRADYRTPNETRECKHNKNGKIIVCDIKTPPVDIQNCKFTGDSYNIDVKDYRVLKYVDLAVRQLNKHSGHPHFFNFTTITSLKREVATGTKNVIKFGAKETACSSKLLYTLNGFSHCEWEKNPVETTCEATIVEPILSNDITVKILCNPENGSRLVSPKNAKQPPKEAMFQMSHSATELKTAKLEASFKPSNKNLRPFPKQSKEQENQNKVSTNDGEETAQAKDNAATKGNSNQIPAMKETNGNNIASKQNFHASEQKYSQSSTLLTDVSHGDASLKPTTNVESGVKLQTGLPRLKSARIVPPSETAEKLNNNNGEFDTRVHQETRLYNTDNQVSSKNYAQPEHLQTSDFYSHNAEHVEPTADEQSPAVNNAPVTAPYTAQKSKTKNKKSKKAVAVKRIKPKVKKGKTEKPTKKEHSEAEATDTSEKSKKQNAEQEKPQATGKEKNVPEKNDTAQSGEKISATKKENKTKLAPPKNNNNNFDNHDEVNAKAQNLQNGNNSEAAGVTSNAENLKKPTNNPSEDNAAEDTSATQNGASKNNPQATVNDNSPSKSGESNSIKPEGTSESKSEEENVVGDDKSSAQAGESNNNPPGENPKNDNNNEKKVDDKHEENADEKDEHKINDKNEKKVNEAKAETIVDNPATQTSESDNKSKKENNAASNKNKSLIKNTKNEDKRETDENDAEKVDEDEEKTEESVENPATQASASNSKSTNQSISASSNLPVVVVANKGNSSAKVEKKDEHKSDEEKIEEEDEGKTEENVDNPLTQAGTSTNKPLIQSTPVSGNVPAPAVAGKNNPPSDFEKENKHNNANEAKTESESVANPPTQAGASNNRLLTQNNVISGNVPAPAVAGKKNSPEKVEKEDNHNNNEAKTKENVGNPSKPVAASNNRLLTQSNAVSSNVPAPAVSGKNNFPVVAGKKKSSAVAGKNNSPAGAGNNNSPAVADSNNSPAVAGSNNSPAKVEEKDKQKNDGKKVDVDEEKTDEDEEKTDEEEAKTEESVGIPVTQAGVSNNKPLNQSSAVNGNVQAQTVAGKNNSPAKVETEDEQKNEKIEEEGKKTEQNVGNPAAQSGANNNKPLKSSAVSGTVPAQAAAGKIHSPAKMENKDEHNNNEEKVEEGKAKTNPATQAGASNSKSLNQRIVSSKVPAQTVTSKNNSPAKVETKTDDENDEQKTDEESETKTETISTSATQASVSGGKSSGKLPAQTGTSVNNSPKKSKAGDKNSAVESSVTKSNPQTVVTSTNHSLSNNNKNNSQETNSEHKDIFSKFEDNYENSVPQNAGSSVSTGEPMSSIKDIRQNARASKTVPFKAGKEMGSGKLKNESNVKQPDVSNSSNPQLSAKISTKSSTANIDEVQEEKLKKKVAKASAISKSDKPLYFAAAKSQNKKIRVPSQPSPSNAENPQKNTTNINGSKVENTANANNTEIISRGKNNNSLTAEETPSKDGKAITVPFYSSAHVFHKNNKITKKSTYMDKQLDKGIEDEYDNPNAVPIPYVMHGEMIEAVETEEFSYDNTSPPKNKTRSQKDNKKIAKSNGDSKNSSSNSNEKNIKENGKNKKTNNDKERQKNDELDEINVDLGSEGTEEKTEGENETKSKMMGLKVNADTDDSTPDTMNAGDITDAFSEGSLNNMFDSESIQQDDDNLKSSEGTSD